jgi:hypothetical protein
MPPVPPVPPEQVAGPEPGKVLPSMHVFGMAAAVIVTVTVASAGVRVATVKLKPPAGSMYV